MKKIILSLIALLASTTLLTGCSLFNKSESQPQQSQQSEQPQQLSKKAEAVKATKATFEGILKGNKSEYEGYYGVGTYDSQLRKLISEGDFSSIADNTASFEKKKELFKLKQSIESKTKIDYEERDETSVVLQIHKTKLERATLDEWLKRKLASGAITRADLTNKKKVMQYVLKAVSDGELPIVESKIVTQSVTVKEENGKLVVNKFSLESADKEMFEVESN